ncbi:uncharacterized protein LOC112342633 [Selaginella moellendorffii]|uniref:uncharacterized protein LOC112342633 n=1 Tax=Selaginella moellendorffii TaxID=88036 RepID=UPI000D1D0DC9|nr:uncharacterized protein LOC112342633 [Selaginella moellendorffii]|eukprot:XP_024520495.1 uncharacterized protein LOC112342633 [Selaginella moellendorffii]
MQGTEAKDRSAPDNLDDYLGSSVLAGTSKIFVRKGWDSVESLKSMTRKDVKALGLTKQQRKAFEMRNFLGKIELSRYADTLEASGKTLSSLRASSSFVLICKYGMEKDDALRFLEHREENRQSKVEKLMYEECIPGCIF